MDLLNYKIKSITLNVSDLTKMSEFYRDIIGLSVLEQSEDKITMGILSTNSVLLTLIETDQAQSLTTGLYHTAFLVPNRSELGNFFNHLILSEYPIQGASDHGYSEAIYLADPEGNGIEVYVDKNISKWDIREGGEIVGITERMDVDGVLNSANGNFDLMADDTIIGHIHLSVSNIPKTNQFFEDVLGFDITTEFASQAAFYGKDGYHHQFAGNIWNSNNYPNNIDTDLGIKDLVVSVSQREMDQTLSNLKSNDYKHSYDNNVLSFVEPNGIKIYYELI